MPLFQKCDLQAQFTTNYKLPLTSYNKLQQLRTIYTNVEQVRLNQNNNNYDDNKNNSNENKNNNYYVCYPFPWKESMSDPLEASSWRPPLGGLLLEAFSWTPPLEGLLLKASSWRFGGIQ